MTNLSAQSYSAPQIALQLLTSSKVDRPVASGEIGPANKSLARGASADLYRGDTISMSPVRAIEIFSYADDLKEIVQQVGADEVRVHLPAPVTADQSDVNRAVQTDLLAEHPKDADLRKAILDGTFVLKIGKDVPAGLEMTSIFLSFWRNGSIQGGYAHEKANMDYFSHMDPGHGKSCGTILGVDYYCSWPKS